MPEDVLPREILEHPELDGPRLAYAELLEARGDPRRAEFIRVQCEIATLEEDDPRFLKLWAREHKLAGNNFSHGDSWYSYSNIKPKWAGPIRELVGEWMYRRGFVEGIRLKVKLFLQKSDELFRRAPLRHVQFWENELEPGAIAALASDANLARLTEIGFNHTPVRDAGLQLLLNSPHVGQLSLLRLHSCGITETGARVLATSPRLASLKVLDLRDSEMPYQLLHYNAIGPGFARALATSPYLTCLRSLQLGAEPADYCGHGIGDEGVAFLAASANLANLTSLDLSCNQIGDPGALALANSPHLGRLTNLDLRRNQITATGVQALIDSPHLTRLATIGLSSNPGGFRIEYCYDQGSYVWSHGSGEGRERLAKSFHRKVNPY